MNFFVTFISILLSALLLGFVLPWWSIVIPTFGIPLIVKNRPIINFLTAFLAIFVLWYSYAFYIDYTNQYILSRRLAVLFGLSTPLLSLLTGLIGGLLGGISALTSGYFIKLIKR